MITRRTTIGLLATAFVAGLARSAAAGETAYFKDKIAAGELPPVAGRLPKVPRIIDTAALGGTPGTQGGRLRILIGGQRDVRLVPINSYSRLVGYDRDLKLQADILESFTVEEERIFTFRLREGHRWSSGDPFTAEDFRYCWEEVILNRELLKGGPPTDLLVELEEVGLGFGSLADSLAYLQQVLGMLDAQDFTRTKPCDFPRDRSQMRQKKEGRFGQPIKA